MKEIAIICNLTAGSGQAEKRWEKFQMKLGSASIDYRPPELGVASLRAPVVRAEGARSFGGLGAAGCWFGRSSGGLAGE